MITIPENTTFLRYCEKDSVLKDAEELTRRDVPHTIVDDYNIVVDKKHASILHELTFSKFIDGHDVSGVKIMSTDASVTPPSGSKVFSCPKEAGIAFAKAQLQSSGFYATYVKNRKKTIKAA